MKGDEGLALNAGCDGYQFASKHSINVKGNDSEFAYWLGERA
jgi:hypothetical protein